MMELNRFPRLLLVQTALLGLSLLSGCHIVADGTERDARQALIIPEAAWRGAWTDIKNYERVRPAMSAAERPDAVRADEAEKGVGAAYPAVAPSPEADRR